MKILEIEMKHFGKFTNKKMTFHSGINVIYGENETGKSTMGAFVRAMFYGLTRGRGRAAEGDEYSVRQPWENGSYFAGTLRFESGRKVFRLERSFSKHERSDRLICETDGEELDIARGDLAALLDDMSEDAFCNTVYFGQQSGKTQETLASEIRNEMIQANGGGVRLDVTGALESLKEERKRLEKEKKQKIAEKVTQMQELAMKIDYTQQEIDALASQEIIYREQLASLREAVASEEDEESFRVEATEEDGGTAVWKIGKIAMAVIAVAALAVGLVMTAWEARVGAAAAILLSCIGVRFFAVRDAQEKERRREAQIARREQAMQARYEAQRRKMKRQSETAPERQKLAMNIEWTAGARREKSAELKELQEESELLRSRGDAEQELEDRISAVYLAIDALTEAASEIYREYAAQMNTYASEILEQITDGKYTGMFLDEQFQVRIQTPQNLLSVWQVSRGTQEQIYFALRMACARFLDAQESMPLILDDAFLTYDDARLTQTLRWLRSGGRQVLLFTCHKREQEIMQHIYGEA